MSSIIKDVIYRFVPIPELCQKFIDTPEFNRLRRIKQLGLASYVYPSAVHTRFEHCIGVMHMAGKFVDVLMSSSEPPKDLGGSADPLDDLSQDPLSCSYIPAISQREKELVQLAGLYHDVGHVAFSHLTDYILEEKKVDKSLAHHENRSILILKQVNNRIKKLSKREVKMVSKMILGDTEGEEKPFLFEIVSNKAFGLDVDRLDYVQRDLYHVGMPCFQADYILECLRIKDGRLSVLRKAKYEIEMMFEARRRLLLLVCRHKTTMKAEKLIREAMERLDLSESWFRDNWLSFDDGKVHCLMEEKCPDILDRMYGRNWPEITEEEKMKNLSCVKRDEIDEQLSQVFWYD